MTSNGFITIGEAATRSGVPSKAIRYYEEIGLIERAGRLANQYRAYDDKDIQTLRFVNRARRLGFSLKEVRDLLALYHDRNRASADVKRLALEHVAEIERKIAELAAIRDTIADLAHRCHGDHRPDCPILNELEASEGVGGAGG